MRERRLAAIYQGMKQRCYNTNRPNYKYYGGRGIVICDEWLSSSQAFFDWAMANGYQENLTIDRINNDGNYEPQNCRWVSAKEQATNKRPRTRKPHTHPRSSNTGVARVTYDKKNSRYRVFLRNNHYVGSRKSLQEAIALREQAEKEVYLMTKEQKELIELIRNSDNPQMAIYKVLGIIEEVTKEPDSAYYEGNDLSEA